MSSGVQRLPAFITAGLYDRRHAGGALRDFELSLMNASSWNCPFAIGDLSVLPVAVPHDAREAHASFIF